MRGTYSKVTDSLGKFKSFTGRTVLAIGEMSGASLEEK